MDNKDFIIDKNTYILARDSKNNNVTNHEIHNIVFKIVLEIDRICRKHKIPYALSFGSALGLYNYADFIPWDDDADIVINYEDYMKFVNALKEDLDSDFTFECYEDDGKSPVIIPPIKIRYRHSYIKDKCRFTIPNRAKRSNGLFVDVCPLLGVPKDKKEHKKLLLKGKLLMPWHVLFDGLLRINPKWIKNSLKKYEKEVAEKYKDSDYVSQTIIIPFQEYPKKIVSELAFPKEVIYPFKEYEFRGKKIYSFNNVEEFCRLRYGEKSLKKLEKGKYVEPYKDKSFGSHFGFVEIYKK